MTDATTRTILCVDDSEGHLKILELSLTAHGYRVALAENGHDALTLLQSMTPDLMIVDIDMPFLDGFELTRQVRRLRRFDGVPIVIMTAAERKGLSERSAAVGADTHIRKPVQGKNLARMVGELIHTGRTETVDR